MKKKLLSLALVLVLALTLLPTAAFAEEPEGETTPIEAPAASETPTVPENTEPEQKQETTPESTPITTETPAAPTLAAPAAEGSDPGTGDPPAGDTPATPTTTCSHSRTHHDAIAATCQTTGNVEYWSCSETPSCGNFDAASGGNLIADVTIAKLTTHDWDTTKEPSECKTTGCTATCDHTGKTGTCTTCGKVLSTSTPPTGHTHELLVVQGTPATCKDPGTQLHYKCKDSSCNKLFSDPEGTKEISQPVVIPATGKHTAPADGTGGYISSTQHSYTCTVCGQTATGEHTYVNGVCTVCNTTQTSTPSPYRYIDISSAYVNRYSISLTWASDLPGGTLFDIYVDGGLYASAVAPSKSSSGYFSYTADFSHYLNDSYYTVAVYLYSDHSVYDSTRVYNRYYDDDYWYPDYYPNGTPGTNSSGIPYASQVTGRYSASEAIRILRNSNHGTLQHDLLNSTYASNSFSDLEAAVKRVNNVSVQVNIDRSDVPSAIRNIRIDGAAFNASRTNSTVRLEVDAPSVNRYPGYGYQFSMSLTGVGNDSSLDVPVVVSMPLPSDINSNFVRVLHYHNSNVPTVITPQVSGGRIRFTLTGFSDFVITDNGVPYTYVSDGLGGYYVRRDLTQQQLAVALPILTTVPTGYVYTDVSGNYWASSEIAWAQSAGILSGYTDGTFRPYSGTTRQELWMVLARLSGANPAHMQAARDWAMNAGITDGRNPESPLSHQQMITMLYRYASYRGMNLAAPTTNLSLYRDSASISPYARTPMAWAINRGIVTGNGTGYLNPQNIASRADFAVYLYRFVQ